MKIVNVCILQSDGTNCDNELFYAFKKFGGTGRNGHFCSDIKFSRNFANDQIALSGDQS